MSDMSDTSETAKKFHCIKKQDWQVALAKVRTSRRVAGTMPPSQTALL
jgi:hypothetical protein